MRYEGCYEAYLPKMFGKLGWEPLIGADTVLAVSAKSGIDQETSEYKKNLREDTADAEKRSPLISPPRDEILILSDWHRNWDCQSLKVVAKCKSPIANSRRFHRKS